MRLLLTAVVAVIVSGCAVQNPQRAADIAKCRSYGYVENWRVVDCINDEAEKRRQADRKMEVAAQDDAYCTARTERGSPAYMQCRDAVVQNRSERAMMMFGGGAAPGTNCLLIGSIVTCR